MSLREYLLQRQCINLTTHSTAEHSVWQEHNHASDQEQAGESQNAPVELTMCCLHYIDMCLSEQSVQAEILLLIEGVFCPDQTGMNPLFSEVCVYSQGSAEGIQAVVFLCFRYICICNSGIYVVP